MIIIVILFLAFLKFVYDYHEHPTLFRMILSNYKVNEANMKRVKDKIEGENTKGEKSNAENTKVTYIKGESTKENNFKVDIKKEAITTNLSTVDK